VLRADANDQVTETNEANNERIIPIDIVVPDLRPTEFSFSGEPVATHSVQVTWGAENQGSGSAKSQWYDRVYFSTNDTWEAADPVLVNQYNSRTLAPGSNYTWTANATLPTVPEGRYWLVLRADANDQVTETNEANNERIISINIVVPDLIVTDFRVLSGSVAEGSVRVGWTIQNQGAGSAKSSWYDRVYFSTNEVWETGDPQLHSSYESRVVAPGAGYGRTNTLTLPAAPPGHSYLILRTDVTGTVFETAETNNTAVLALDPAGLLPQLSIRWAPPRVEVYWPTSAVSFTLQGASRLGPAAEWAMTTNTVTTSGTDFVITLDPWETSRFFRLVEE
jgi:subtilase family serine protease